MNAAPARAETEIWALVPGVLLSLLAGIAGVITGLKMLASARGHTRTSPKNRRHGLV